VKTTIEFDDDADREKIIRSLQGPIAFDVLWNVDQHIRMQIKHGDLSEAVADALQAVRDYLHTSAAEHGISIDA
jgi:hypothetical protein